VQDKEHSVFVLYKFLIDDYSWLRQLLMLEYTSGRLVAPGCNHKSLKQTHTASFQWTITHTHPRTVISMNFWGEDWKSHGIYDLSFHYCWYVRFISNQRSCPWKPSGTCSQQRLALSVTVHSSSFPSSFAHSLSFLLCFSCPHYSIQNLCIHALKFNFFLLNPSLYVTLTVWKLFFKFNLIFSMLF
jgi:hypothetical protein